MRLTNTTSNRSGTSHWTLEIEANEIGKADFDWEKYAHLRESDDVSDNLYGLALLAEAVEAIKPTCNVPDCEHELLNQGPPPGQWVCPVHSSKGTT